MNKFNNWAKWYDIIYKSKDNEEYEFYHDLIKNNQPALEMACGTGRLYIKYLKDGFDVHGLDISEKMLNQTRRKAQENNVEPVLFNKNALHMELDKTYNLIYYPFNSISHFTSLEDQQKVISNCYKHLKQDGIFAFDMYVPSFEKIHNYEQINTQTQKIEDEEYIIGKWSKLVNEVEQVFSHNTMVINKNTGKIVYNENFNLSLLPKQQVESLLINAGFSDYTFYDGFSDEEINKDTEKYSVIAKK